MDKKNKVEFIDEEEIITLYDDKDEAVDFYEIACIEYEKELYVLLQPVELTDGIDEDEAIICKVEQQDDDTDMFLPVDDQELLEKIFDEYLKAVADHECGCGCDCEDCEDCDDDDCDCGCHDVSCDDCDGCSGCEDCENDPCEDDCEECDDEECDCRECECHNCDGCEEK